MSEGQRLQKDRKSSNTDSDLGNSDWNMSNKDWFDKKEDSDDKNKSKENQIFEEKDMDIAADACEVINCALAVEDKENKEVVVSAAAYSQKENSIGKRFN